MLLTLAGTLMTGCSKDDEEGSAVAATNKGTFTDARDGQQYGYATFGGLDWMTENARYDINDDVNSTTYLDSDENGATGTPNYGSMRNVPLYGRLYTLEGAKKACPDGWRLPTDADWQRLEQVFGMSADESASDGWRGNNAHHMLVLYDQQNDLNLRLGGYYFQHAGYNGNWLYMGAMGYYWSATADTSKVGEFYYVRKFAYNRPEVCRLSMEPTTYKLSVRYVRDAQ